ncbi:hypothetical protein Aperf_G00000048604 [Anoplocephala perfoliata]
MVERFLSKFWSSETDFKRSVKEAINAENKGRILKYYKCFEYFATGKIDVKDFIEQSSRIFLSEMDGLNSMNFVNLILMLYNCCGSEFHSEVTKEENLRSLFEMLRPMSGVNNIASKKLALFIKFVDSLSSSIFSNHPLLTSLKPEDFQASSWVPEMSIVELNRLEMLLLRKYAYDTELPKIYSLIRLEPDIEKVNEAKLQAEAYSNRLKRDCAFFQDVVQSFLPFENMVDSLNRISNKTGEILANIDNILQQRVGEETYHVLERNFIERYNEKVDKEGIDSRIDSVINRKGFESINVEILPLVSNIEADYKILVDLLIRENIRKSPSKAAERIFEWSQRTKKQINDLSKAFGEVDWEQHHLLSSTEARTHSTSASQSDDIVSASVGKDVVRSVLSMGNTSNSLNRFSKQVEETSASTDNNEIQESSIRETYYALERNFIARYNDFAVMRKVEAEIDSVTDKEQLEAIKVKILPTILKIEEEYHALIDLSNRATVRKSPTVKKVFEWSQRIESQIDDLSKAFNETGVHEFQPSAVAQTRLISASKNGAFSSTSEMKTLSLETFRCPQCEKVFYSEGFLRTHLNLEHVCLVHESSPLITMSTGRIYFQTVLFFHMNSYSLNNNSFFE